MTYGRGHVCEHCWDVFEDHPDNKCLYEPTYFKPVNCIACNGHFYESATTNTVDGVRYFMCSRCADHTRRVESYDPTKRQLVNQYVRTDTYITTWLLNRISRK